MGFSCGLIGLPNVGKSTLFNALTNSQIAAENYPFCTIAPNQGIAAVPDPRLAALEKLVQPRRTVPAAMHFTDIAGLIPGASKGAGLGNQFLCHIAQTEALLHVVRCFDDPDVVHVNGEANPLNDIQQIEDELILADLQTIEQALQKNKRGEAALLKQLNAVQKHLANGAPARSFAAVDSLHSWRLLSAKPVLFIANCGAGEKSQKEEEMRAAIQQYAVASNSGQISICAALEAQMIDFSASERDELLALEGYQGGLRQLIHAGYQLLQRQTFFTAGVKELRAWTIRQHALAPQAAGAIHSDMEQGFIRAEIIAYDDFLSCRGALAAREAGKRRIEGRDYQMTEGDIALFHFSSPQQRRV